MSLDEKIYVSKNIYSTLYALNNKFQIKLDEYDKDITVRQVMVMLSIAHLPKSETTFNNISRKLGTTKQSIKQISDILAKKGFVEIVPSLLDKRAINVHITECGKDVLKRAINSSRIFFVQISSIFTVEELEILDELLTRLYSFDGKKLEGLKEKIDIDNILN